MKSIHVVAETLPEAFEKAMVQTWENGARFKTQYDQEERGDPLSRDVTAMINITDPMKEPRIHRAIIGGIDSLELYRSELVLGCHDYFMDDLNNPNRWQYTYFQRLFEYDVIKPVPPNSTDGIFPAMGSFMVDRINQIQKCIEMLKECGYTRRAQAVTWQAWKDLGIHDPACLQRLWMRIEDGKLNMNVHFRSNDLTRAWLYNIWGFTELQAYIAQQVGVGVGSMCWIADSLHQYGSNFEQVRGLLKMMETRKFEDRVYSTNFAIPFFIEACDILLLEEKMPEVKKQLIRERKLYLESLL